MNSKIYQAASMATKTLEMNSTSPDDIVDCIQLHAGLAVAAAWIPIGGLDVAALTANIWTMYARINKFLGVSFSENIMKSIGSAVMANLASNLALTGVAAALKYIPGIGTFAGGMVMGATVYGTTIGAAWIYLTAITNWAKKGKGSGDDLKSCIEEVINLNKDKINDIIQDEKANYSA